MFDLQVLAYQTDLTRVITFMLGRELSGRTYAEIEHPHVGAEWVYGVPWVLGDTPGEVHTPAPTLGQHNEFVFHQLLGVPIERLERLRSEKVIY